MNASGMCRLQSQVLSPLVEALRYTLRRMASTVAVSIVYSLVDN